MRFRVFWSLKCALRAFQVVLDGNRHIAGYTLVSYSLGVQIRPTSHTPTAPLTAMRDGGACQLQFGIPASPRTS